MISIRPISDCCHLQPACFIENLYKASSWLEKNKYEISIKINST
jgi:hypothetical protein